ncbi:Putative MamJ protein [Rhodospirillaceae bacterium LM-1]|nr:Putative MamJ protein [Rhodospirillaceae bacterium LM-1]
MVKEKKRQSPKKQAPPSAPKKPPSSEPVRESAPKRQVPAVPVQESASPKSLATMLAEMGTHKGFMATRTQGEGHGKTVAGQAKPEAAHGAPSEEAPPALPKALPPSRDILALMEQAPWAKKATSRLTKPASAVKEPAPPVALWSQAMPAPEEIEEKEAEEDGTVPSPAPPSVATPSAPSWQTLLESQPWLQRMRPVLHHNETQEARSEPKPLGDMLSDKRVSAPLQELIWQKVSADVAPHHSEPDAERAPPDEAAEEEAKVPSLPQAPPELADPVAPQVAPAASEEEATDPNPFPEPSEAPPAAEMPLEKTASDIPKLRDEQVRQVEKAPALLADLLVSSKTAPAPAPVPKPTPANPPPKQAGSNLPEPGRKEVPVEDLLGGVISLFGSGVKGVSSLFRRKSGTRN